MRRSSKFRFTFAFTLGCLIALAFIAAFAIFFLRSYLDISSLAVNSLWKTINASLFLLLGVSMLGIYLIFYLFRQAEHLEKEKTKTDVLLQENQTSKERLAGLTQELKNTNEELLRFAYIASHDLKEPSRMVATYVSLLDKELTESLSVKQVKYLKYASEGAERLCSIIDSLLSFYRLQSKVSEKKEVPLNDLLEKVLQGLKPLIDEKHAKIQVETLPSIKGEEMQLIQLFQNLISNAIKFHKEGISPEIHISSQKMAHEVIIKISDNGIGISSSHFNRIFKVLERLHTRSQYPGDGIGLAACKKIVESHGGSIWLESQLGKGTSFFVSFNT